MIKLGASELRNIIPPLDAVKAIKKNPVFIIVDNVMDTYNIGAIFRLADAVACQKVYLCGGSETPPHTRIKKASINTTEWVSWEHKESAKSTIQELRSKFQDIKIISIEQSDKSVPYTEIPYTFPVAFIVGHETTGVTTDAMDASDYIAEIPMWGVNKSMNVMVSLGILLFKAMENFKE